MLRWFEQQPVCPLCKTKRTSDFVRTLRAPQPLTPDDEALLETHLQSAEPVDAVLSRLTTALSRSTRDHDELLLKRDKASEMIGAKRSRIQKLQVLVE